MEEERTDERTGEIAGEAGGDGVSEIDGLRGELVELRAEADINAAMLEAGVRDTAAVREILESYIGQMRAEDGRVPELGERLAELAADAGTMQLFWDSTPKYMGSLPGESGIDPQIAGEEIGFEAELRSARESGDFLKAIRIKQEAAKEGIILI